MRKAAVTIMVVLVAGLVTGCLTLATGTTTIQLRRDTAADWTSTNPILAAGEPGLETDTGKVKYGNGSAHWNSLPYFGVMTWPSGGAGIPNYNGSSGWGASYSASNKIPSSILGVLSMPVYAGCEYGAECYDKVLSAYGEIGSVVYAWADKIPPLNTMGHPGILMGNNLTGDFVDAVAGVDYQPAVMTVYDNGTCTTTKAIDPANGERQTLLLGGNCIVTVALSAAGTSRKLRLKVTQGATPYTLDVKFTGGARVLYPSGSTPTMSTGSGAIDWWICDVDDTQAFCLVTQNFLTGL